MSRAQELLQELAVTHAAVEVLKGREGELRAEADRLLMESHEQFGSHDALVRVFGSKVGKLSVSVSNPRILVEDPDEWQGFLKEMHGDGDDRVRASVVYDAPAIMNGLAVDGGRVVDPVTGVVARGVAYRPGGAVCGTKLTGCRRDEVLAALRAAGKGIEGVFGYLGAPVSEVSE